MKRWPLILLLLALVSPFQLQAQEKTLRERIKERMAERKQNKESAASSPNTITQPGDYSYTLQQGDLKRAYLIHVPPGYKPDTPMPVVFAFHGGGGNMTLQADTNYNVVAKADSAGFIAVFPNGYSRLPAGKLATWNAGNCCAQARDREVDDVGFVRALVAQVQKQLNVDSTRLYATGMSNGGMMSHRLACEMADIFAAIAPVAGTDNTQSCKPSKPISVLHIHAKNDTHVLYNGGAGEDAFKDKSMVTDFTSVPETVRRWTERNRCTGQPKRVLDVPGAVCEAYQQCADGVQVQVCTTETGGHSWPGANTVRSGKEAASQAINANDQMWDFFQRVPGR